MLPQGTRSDPGHGVQGERGHLVRGLHHGRDDQRGGALPRDGPHRPVEQDNRAAGHPKPGFHAPTTGHCPQLC